MNLQEAIKRIIELRGKPLTKGERWKLSRLWRKGVSCAAVEFTSVSLGYGGFNSEVITDGKKEIYIGIPGAFRVWLRMDGTYKLDIPNEAATQTKAKA